MDGQAAPRHEDEQAEQGVRTDLRAGGADVARRAVRRSGWVRPKQFGNVLVTFPNGEWRVPHSIWHSDFDPGFDADRLFAVKLWALCDDVEAGAGGTP